MSKLVRRAKKFRGYTDKLGYKRDDAPKNWPFGLKRPFVSKAKPRALMKRHRTLRVCDMQGD